MKRSTAGIVLTTVLLLLILVSAQGPQPPAVAGTDAPAQDFSAERAWRHVEAIAVKPHAMGTAEHDRVREYVVGQLRDLGVEPTLQDAIVYRDRQGVALFSRVINVLGRIEGANEGKAVLLMSHYDTVPAGPGAGDDSTGVAVMLETLRALGQDPGLANDVILLFTDGEEAGLMGAHAFLDQHPWAKEVGVVLNFEARGTEGASLMFETSPGNGPLLAELDAAVARPAAYSYSYEVYSRMPNDTDYSPFKRAGYPGLNFAFIGGATAYHSAQDNLERLDPRSIQHHGDSALALVRRFGNADMSASWKGGNAVYFTLPGNFFARYSGALVMPLALILALAAGVVIFLGLRRRRLTAGGLVLGLLVTLLTSVVVTAILTFFSSLFMRFYNYRLGNGMTSVSLSVLALALLAAGLTIALYGLASRKVSAESFIGAGLVLWLVLSVAVSVIAPGGSYLFALPLATAVALGALWFRQEDAEKVSALLLVLLVVAAAVTVFLWAPSFGLLGTALGRVAAIVVGAVVPLLLLGPLAAYLSVVVPARSRVAWISSAVLIVLAVAVIFMVRSGSRFSDSNRRPVGLAYHLDTEGGTAQWVSFGRTTDEWTSKYLTGQPERRERPTGMSGFGKVPAADAPALDLEGASVEWLGEEGAGGPRRTLRMRLSWPYDVHRAVLYFRSNSAILGFSTGEQSAVPQDNIGPGEQAHRKKMVVLAPPDDGLVVEVELGGDEPLEIDATSQSYRLPELVEPRPAHLMPGFSRYTDSTFVRSVHTWTPGMEPATEESGSEDSGGTPVVPPSG